ncbi:hypothetical protein CGCVW01_v007290 [Colletotrichum viniferum]|nr:hypothetical protein CGCVW01_v007290 [Colletotrichum viniferum]
MRASSRGSSLPIPTWSTSTRRTLPHLHSYISHRMPHAPYRRKASTRPRSPASTKITPSLDSPKDGAAMAPTRTRAATAAKIKPSCKPLLRPRVCLQSSAATTTGIAGAISGAALSTG